MRFCDVFNHYLTILNVSYPAFAQFAGMSVSSIRRYKNGESEPASDSEQLRKIADGFAGLAEERHITLDADEVFDELQRSLKNHLAIDYSAYAANLNMLLKQMDIRVTVLAKALSFDPSYISKILSGQRKPAHIDEFTQNVASFVSRNCTDESHIRRLSALLGRDETALENPRERCGAIVTWLGTNTEKNSDPISGFLDKMDAFCLDDFIRAIHFDDIKLPTVPFQLPGTKNYYGIQDMMASELDFMKATVVSKSMKDCILYSDMPMEEMAKDPEFPKKWMFGRAMMLKKGLRLHIIHDVNRPFHEMMLGLESYIPMYMTGQIAPYYLPVTQGSVFNHLLNVSGAAALEGNAIAGHQSSGKYTLYKSKDDIQHFRMRAEQLLKKAEPLMDIYRSDRKAEFDAQTELLWTEGDRHVVNCSLPLFTIAPELLEQILRRVSLSETDKEQIRRYRAGYLSMAEKLLTVSKVTLVLPKLSEEQFAETPLNLALSELFIETDVPYRYEEYRAHLEQTCAFAQTFPNLTLQFDVKPPFRNISYTVVANRHVIVSKNKYPAIHFIIHHRKMVQAFQNFIPPVDDPK